MAEVMSRTAEEADAEEAAVWQALTSTSGAMQ